MKRKRILVACEESQRVTIELRNLGFEAYSNDLLPAGGGKPEFHLQTDVREIINDGWDMVIAFPPCTFLTVTGNRWFNVERYGEKAIQRIQDREEAIDFFKVFANSNCDCVAIENPVGIMSSEWRKPDQIIHPWQFGGAFEKKTCLWLKGLPKLQPTDIVEPEPRMFFKSGKSMPRWYAEAIKLPKKERSILRSKTFPGIAEAMADQWGSFLNLR